jgi:hypothetical protein
MQIITGGPQNCTEPRPTQQNPQRAFMTMLNSRNLDRQINIYAAPRRVPLAPSDIPREGKSREGAPCDPFESSTIRHMSLSVHTRISGKRFFAGSLLVGENA